MTDKERGEIRRETREKCATELEERANLFYRSSQECVKDGPAYDPDNAGSYLSRSHDFVRAAKYLRGGNDGD